MDDNLRRQRDTSLAGLEVLIRRGRQIRNTPAADAVGAWQRDCAAAINQLSGGSKAHWLARAYSGAFLVRSAPGGVILEVDTTEIVERILGVLSQGATSLSGMEDVAASSGAAPRPRRFEFVRNAELRPVLEQAFAGSRDALERGEFALALILSCGVIEAVLTDALDGAEARAHDAPEGHRAEWSFERRIAAAESAGLIRGGCARLPPVARRYRDLTDADGELRGDAPVSEREARLAGQVLQVVMRDLDPGR
ncbi:MAG: hypothetical protein NEA02_13615 [Thermoanaerobaculia bacterium]|nr:hypothetical protein [Thermoanaerobaculia bacterium]